MSQMVEDNRIRSVRLKREGRNVRQIGTCQVHVLVGSHCGRRRKGHGVRGVERCSRKAA